MSYFPSIPFPDGAIVPGALAQPADASPVAEPAKQARAELNALVTRARAGDLNAQSDLVRRYIKRISGYVRPMVGRFSAVDDVVQTVFIKMVRRLGHVREVATFESWLFTLARNTAVDYIRHTRCRPKMVSGEVDYFETPGTDSARAMPEIMEALDLALKHLSPKDRRIVSLVVLGHSYRTVANREGISIGAVKLRLNRVRPFLRASVGGAIGVAATGAASFRSPPRSRAAA